MAKPQNCNRPAVPQMRERGLRSVLVAHEQADDKADVVLLNGYVFFDEFYSCPYSQLNLTHKWGCGIRGHRDLIEYG